MYLIRRVLKTQPGKAWEVAGYLAKMTAAYENAGRNKCQIYVGGQGLPGPNVVYAEWTQEKIEPTNAAAVPQMDIIRENNAKMQALLTEYSIEFYDLVTPEKLQARGVA